MKLFYEDYIYLFSNIDILFYYSCYERESSLGVISYGTLEVWGTSRSLKVSIEYHNKHFRRKGKNDLIGYLNWAVRAHWPREVLPFWSIWEGRERELELKGLYDVTIPFIGESGTSLICGQVSVSLGWLELQRIPNGPYSDDTNLAVKTL